MLPPLVVNVLGVRVFPETDGSACRGHVPSVYLSQSLHRVIGRVRRPVSTPCLNVLTGGTVAEGSPRRRRNCRISCGPSLKARLTETWEPSERDLDSIPFATIFDHPCQTPLHLRDATIPQRDGQREDTRAVTDDLPFPDDGTARSEHDLMQIVENAGTGIGLLDHHGHWLQMNHRLRAMLGYRHADLAMHTLSDLLDPDEKSLVKAAFRTLQTGPLTSYDLTTRCRRGDGQQIWVDLTLTLLDGDRVSPPCFIAVVHDVTCHHDTERHARATADEAIALRDQFLSVAAHELKTPLTPLLALSQIAERTLAREEPPDRDRLRRYLRIIGVQARKLATLVDQVLDLERWEEGHLTLDRQPTDVTTRVEGVVALVRAVDASHPIIIRASGPIIADVDPLRLEQVLTNLLDNATKYSPAGSPIEVELQASSTALGIAVTDHGIGIPREQREHLFERFYQAHRKSYQSGLGLGLFFSRRIVKQHRGTLTAEFPAEGGTRFLIQLPLSGGCASEKPPDG